MKVSHLLLAVGTSLAVAVPACKETPEAAPIEAPIPAACRDIPVDAFKELMIVDDAIVGDARGRNAEGGLWSFRHVIESIMPQGGDPSAFVAAWLNSFKQAAEVNLFNVPPRLSAPLDELVLCPWLRARPENACDATCAECAERRFDLQYAPFRLLAIVNRVDLRETSADPNGTGEGRLVFGATTGPSDDPASVPIRFTTTFEFHLPTTQTPRQWAERWHALGQHAAFDDAYRADLEQLTESFVRRDPAGASALRQVRTNEREFDWQWDLREFVLDMQTGNLALSATFNTPDKSLNASPELRQWVKDNRDAIARNQHIVPAAMTGGFAQPLERWNVSDGDGETAKLFSSQTCDGCHQNDTIPIDLNFHISPFHKGIEKISPFVHSPEAPDDQLRLRTRAMKRTLCEP